MTIADPSPDPPEESFGLEHLPGGDHYRAYVGPPADYDLVAAMVFGLLTLLGLRQQHRVLDVGCGSLRVGRLLIPYLNVGGYTGLEPNRWLVSEAITREVGQDQIAIKKPRFIFDATADALLSDGSRFDYIVAQSIFSHCGPDLLESWIDHAARLLTDQGTLVATFIEDETSNSTPGWIYPDCVGYQREVMARLADQHDLDFVMLDWHHPRQRWFLMAKRAFKAQEVAGELDWNRAFPRLNGRGQH